MNRAYSVLTIKAVDEEKRILEGIATTPSPDRMRDVIEPKGMTFRLPLPLLYQHDVKQPIGQVLDAKVKDDGIRVKAQLAPPGTTAWIDEAWALIKAGLVRGFSVGFKSLEDALDRETGGIRYLKSEWLELSAVTIPANAEATILNIKSADAARRTVSGATRNVVQLTIDPATLDRLKIPEHVQNLSGVPGTANGNKSVTIQEQITSFENKRAALSARMTAIMDKSGDEGRTLDETETQEFDGLERDVKSVDDHLVRLRAHEKTIVAKATPVTPATTTPTGGGVITVKPNLPKATAFTRYAIAKINCRSKLEAAEFAKQWKDSTPEVEMVLRAEVLPGTTTNPPWAGYLVPTYQTMAGEFLELLRPATIIGRIPGLRRVPFNVKVPAQTGGGAYTWVGETKAKPVTSLTFAEVMLKWHKVAGIIVISKELARFSNPSAEAIIRDDMVAGVAQFLDQQFIDPAKAEVPDVSPASITNGVTPIPASGTTADAFRADMADLFAQFLAVNQDPSQAVLLMSAQNALNLSLMQNALGQAEFPALSMTGGSILGLSVVVSQTVGNRIIMANARDILLADEGGVEIDVSEEASLQMNTTPGEPAGSPVTGVEMVSLWQRNLVGLRVDRFITWKKARAQAVSYISNANYGG